MPLISYKTIDLYDFISIDFVQTDYAFEFDVAAAVINCILNLELINEEPTEFTISAFNFTRIIAYHVICINNLAIYYNDFLASDHFKMLMNFIVMAYIR